MDRLWRLLFILKNQKNWSIEKKWNIISLTYTFNTLSIFLDYTQTVRLHSTCTCGCSFTVWYLYFCLVKSNFLINYRLIIISCSTTQISVFVGWIYSSLVRIHRFEAAAFRTRSHVSLKLATQKQEKKRKQQVDFYSCTVRHSAAPSVRNSYLCFFDNWFRPVWLLHTSAHLDSQRNRPLNTTGDILQFVFPCWLFANLSVIFW